MVPTWQIAVVGTGLLVVGWVVIAKWAISHNEGSKTAAVEPPIATVTNPEAVCKNLKNAGRHMVFTEDGDLVVLKVEEP